MSATVDAAPPGGGELRSRSVDEIRAVILSRHQRKHTTPVPWPPDLMADVWRLPEAAPFLAEGTVRAVYAYLRHVGVSQRAIAAKTGQRQSEISEIMAGRKVQAVAVLARIASGLCLPPATFGLATSTPDGVLSVAGETAEVDGVDGVDDETVAVVDVMSTSPFAAHGRAPSEHCPAHCLCAPAAAPLVEGRIAVPVVPLYWTGVELRGLRLCVHMSVREFAAAMGVSDRMASKWEQGGADVIPRPDNQAAADRLLSRALPLQQARFAAWLVRLHPAHSASAAATAVHDVERGRFSSREPGEGVGEDLGGSVEEAGTP